jgi:hypothetical protein
MLLLVHGVTDNDHFAPSGVSINVEVNVTGRQVLACVWANNKGRCMTLQGA